MKDLVVVPVYNEGATLVPVLTAIRAHYDGDLLAVDDGSTDGSEEQLDGCPGITLLRHPVNLGYGRSLIDGFAYGVAHGYDRLVTIDCDEQHEPSLIPRMFAERPEVDVLSGSRYLPGDDPGDDPPPPERRRVNGEVTERINRITGYRLTDGFCGFKRYRVAALAKLSLDDPGYAMPLQFWVQARHFGLTVAEIRVPRIYQHLDRTFGGGLDDTPRRLAHYHQVIDRECERWRISSS